jgi:hypothetical protein
MQTASPIVVQPMQWARVQDIHDVKPLSDDDAQCLREVRDVLLRHHATERFAVSLIHKHFDLSESEQMVEFTDVVDRTLTIRPLQASESLETIETTWKFAEGEVGAQPLTLCIFRCFSNSNSTPRHAGKHMKG